MKKFLILLLILSTTFLFSKEKRKIWDTGKATIVEINNLYKDIKDLGMYYYILPKKRIKITASSFLKDNKYSYPAKNAIDGNINTSWAEGVKGNGKGEWIKLTLNLHGVKGHPSSIYLIPGYSKSEVHYKKNNRLKTILIDDGDKEFLQKLMFEDKYAFHNFNFS